MCGLKRLSTRVWLDRFFASYYARRPVNATFIGVHDHDGRLPDFSENGTSDTLAEMQTLLAQSELLDQPADWSERTDLRLARGFLRIQIWEYRSRHFHLGNPSAYTGEAIFAVLSLFLSDFSPFSERLAAAIERLEQVPRFLAQGKRNIRRSPVCVSIPHV